MVEKIDNSDKAKEPTLKHALDNRTLGYLITYKKMHGRCTLTLPLTKAVFF